MRRDQGFSAIGASDKDGKPTREDIRLAKLYSTCLDSSLGAVPLPLRVLDVGCGYGDLLHEFAERVPNVIELVGIDPDPVAVDEARTYSGSAARFLLGKAEELPFADEHFDLVVSVLTFHRWNNPRRGLAEVARVLHPAGAFVLAERSQVDIPAALAAAGLRLVRRETVARHFGRPSVRAFIASK